MLAAAPLLAQQPSSSVPASATTPSETSKTVGNKLEQLDQKVAAAQSSADNSWMLVRRAGADDGLADRGLALFYGGLVRRKMCWPS